MSVVLCLNGHGHLGRGSCASDPKAGRPPLEPWQNICGKLGQDFPLAGLLCLHFPGGRNRRPKVRVALEVASSLEALSVQRNKNSLSTGRHNITIQLPTRLPTQFLSQRMAVARGHGGAGMWSEARSDLAALRGDSEASPVVCR